ncbi:MAG: HDIG domain-containing protein [Bacteroidia bacterium]
MRKSRHLARNGIVLAYLLLMTLMMPRAYRLGYQFQENKPWQGEAITAPFDYPLYKSKEQIARDRARAAAQVADIYLPDSVGVALARSRVQERLTVFAQRWDEYRAAGADAARIRELETAFFSKEYPGLVISRLPNGEDWFTGFEQQVSALVDAIYERGYLPATRTDSLGRFIAVRLAPATERYVPVARLLVGPGAVSTFIQSSATTLSGAEKTLATRVLLQELRPNLRYSADLTLAAREQQSALVSPIYGKVQRDEVIVGKGDIVDGEAAEKLRSLIREQELRHTGENRWLTFFSQFLIVSLITGILLNYLRLSRPRIYFSHAKLALIFSIFLLAVSAMVVATKLTDLAVRLTQILGPNINLSYIYLAPACIVPIFVSNFFEFRTGFLCNILVALYGAVLIQQGLEFAFVQTIAGTVAVYSMRRLRERERFFYTLGYIFLAYSVAYLAFNLLGKGSLYQISYQTLLLFAVNVAITVVAYNLIYLFERVFGVTSDLTYLELLDTNHPLLQELARKAPGTFQHSLQVANIAEATIKEIGGNALLIHVGALYHDVGKTLHPEYFIENMSKEESATNPHELISCERSAEIIIGHVRDGVELAQKHHLPKEIVHFIETHHGTTRVEFFYRQYLRENQCAEPTDEELFRYAGPQPFSKETAVLMIADSVEAASRSLKQPTPDKIKELVDGIIDFKIQDNQLENSSLTFKDIATIRKVITKQLLSIYHGRIEYPQEMARQG